MTQLASTNNETVLDDYQVLHQSKALKLKNNSKDYIYYKIGIHKENNDIALSLYDNDGDGLFSKEWITLEAINELLIDKVGIFTSKLFHALFKSRSKNNCGFITAVLKSNEVGFIQKALGYQYQYRIAENYEDVFEHFCIKWTNENKPTESEKTSLTDRGNRKKGQGQEK